MTFFVKPLNQIICLPPHLYKSFLPFISHTYITSYLIDSQGYTCILTHSTHSIVKQQISLTHINNLLSSHTDFGQLLT